MPRIRIASQFHALLDGEPSWYSEATSFSHLVHELGVKHPRLHASVIDMQGRLRSFVAVAIDLDVYVDPSNEELPDLRLTREIEIFSAVAGG